MSENTQKHSDEEIVRNMAGKPVLVIGDIMLDRFVYGRVERISPESPVPVLSVVRENKMLGGSGNALFNLVNLKCKGMILSVIGHDESGQDVKDRLGDIGVSDDGLIVDTARPTIEKTRFLAGHQQLLRTDYEKKHDISKDIADQVIEKAKAMIAQSAAVIISDYGKGMLTNAVLKAVISSANKHKVPVLVDPKGLDYSIYKHADIVTPNKKELSEATAGMPVDTDKDVLVAAQSLIKQSGVKAVVATRSKDGMSVVQGKEEPVHIRSASDIEVFDVSGAGDTVIATIAASLAAGADLKHAASLANVAGSIVVAKVGTAPIRSEELLSTIQNNDVNEVKRPNVDRVRQAPVLTWEEAAEEVQRWKARGLSVGFTNGCFDVVHFGHVTYMNEARRKCDRLVLGLNSDSSVKILKGPERPVHDEDSRAAVMGALGSVDMVVLFGAKQAGDDNTACALLEALKPDVYFKGGDYTVDQIPEAPTVMKHGGKVDVMNVYDGHSTTNSIAKMRA